MRGYLYHSYAGAQMDSFEERQSSEENCGAIFCLQAYYHSSTLLHVMIFHISSQSGVPPYLQLVQQIKQDIQLGLLQEGNKLPTVREVVTMLAINPNTVVKAYRELENQGYIEKRTGIGTFVSRQSAGPPFATQMALLDTLNRWIAEAQAIGLDEEATEALFQMALRKRREERTDANDSK